MNSVFSSVTALAALGAVLPVAQAHMAMWHPSVYGFRHSYEPVTPLANKPFNEWWFHGYANERPSEVMDITAGRDLNVEITCGKHYTSWGNSPSGDACPGDAGSFHAGGSTGSGSGWNGNSESNLMGCALAIAYKPNANQVNPEDFIVMSVQENCVRQRDTSFPIPANLPECPDGECTCAWFWQGRNSAAEMYMNGFRCRVQNGVVGASIPRPAAPRRGNTISGPTQPMYWANSNSNLDYNPGWNDRPSYNRAFGWQNGAQTSAFGPGSGSGGGGGGGGGASPTTSRGGQGGNGNGNGNGESAPTSSTSSRGRRPRPTSSQAGPEFPNYAAAPTVPDTDDDIPSSSPAPAPSAAPTGSGAGSGSGSGSGSGVKPCKSRKRRSRNRRSHVKRVEAQHH